MMSREDLPILNMSNPRHKRLLKGYIDSLEGIYRFEFTRCRNQRTLAQNAYMHGVLFVEIAKGLSEAWGFTVSMLRAKAHMKDEFLRCADVNKETGEIVGYYTRSTADLDVREGSEFIENCIEYAREKLNHEVPPPDRERAA